jgi:hypothetical protein
MAGLIITTRSDVGFVAVDAPGEGAWLYYGDLDTGRFVLDTTEDASTLDDEGMRELDRDRALRAGLDKGLDVIAVPGDGVEDDDEEPAEADLFPDPVDEPIEPAEDLAESED